MKKKDFLWSVLAILMATTIDLSLAACGGGDDDPEPVPSASLAVAPTEISLTANAGAQATFTIASTADWTISSSESWITLSQTSGTGSSAIIVTATTENTNASERTATINVKAGNETKYISIKQAAAEVLALSGLDAPFDASAGNIATAQELTIKCNSNWSIEGKPDWLDISALSGTGNSTIKVWTNSANTSTSNRSAILTVKAGNKSEAKTVIQRAGLDANLNVSPNSIVTLSDGFAFDMKFGSNVKYYYVSRYLPTALDRKTDDEIINEMSSDPNNRDTPSDGYVTSWRNQNPQTEYIICTVGYDQNGNHGALTKTSITTKKGTNQARATISDVGYNETYWHWVTTTNGFVTKYYMWFITRTDLYDAPDAAIAWFFNKEMKSDPDRFPAIAQGDTWSQARNGGTIFHVATWAIDVEGNFSGVIDNFAGAINTSSSKGFNKNYIEDYESSKRLKTVK